MHSPDFKNLLPADPDRHLDYVRFVRLLCFIDKVFGFKAFSSDKNKEMIKSPRSVYMSHSRSICHPPLLHMLSFGPCARARRDSSANTDAQR